MDKVYQTGAGCQYLKVKPIRVAEVFRTEGICDSCNEQLIKGKVAYLVPVLNYAICEECFNKSSIQKNCYEEDRNIEEARVKYWLSLFDKKDLL